MTTIINPSPKTRFQENKTFVDQHKRLIERSDLQLSIDYAMLQYQAQLTEIVAGGNEAAAAHFRLMGAHEFVKIFRTLAHEPEKAVVKNNDNLNYRV